MIFVHTLKEVYVREALLETVGQRCYVRLGPMRIAGMIGWGQKPSRKSPPGMAEMLGRIRSWSVGS